MQDQHDIIEDKTLLDEIFMKPSASMRENSHATEPRCNGKCDSGGGCLGRR